MSVGVRVKCSFGGCGRHCDVDVLVEGGTVQGRMRPRTEVAAAVVVALPAGWKAEGSGSRFRVWCATHSYMRP